MKILIRGAGDLATGIASRLYGAGHQILMTEIKTPLTVRRTVALSRAVYEGMARVEEMTGIFAKDQTEAQKVMDGGDIAVMTDEKAACKTWYHPEVIVDAILAKKNLGTKINDAPFVIGVGPGFTAGEDCNCVVETKRGHTLGNIIWKGSAIPNTGVPGNVAGYTVERLIRASADGLLVPKVQIGDCVKKGQILAYTGNEPVYAQMSGMVRGMLQDGVIVSKNLKIGDVDARTERSNCYTISDKARAIGGGVLEAVTAFERLEGRYGLIILAAGRASRFGSDKLSAEINGKPLYMHMLEKASAFSGFPAVIVTGSEKIAEEAKRAGIVPVYNRHPEKGISLSLSLGLTKVLEMNPDIKGAMFCVCDQPGLSASTLQKIFLCASRHPGSIVCAGQGAKWRNPVCWDRKYFQELLELTGDVGGRQIMGKYENYIRVIQAKPEELKDIDRKEDL